MPKTKPVTKSLKDKILKLRARGKGYKSISKKISNDEEFAHTYSHMWVKRWLDDHQDRVAQYMAQASQGNKEELRDEILNLKNQLEEVNEKAWDIFEQAEKNNVKLSALKEVRRQLQTQNKMLQKIEAKKQQYIQINYKKIVEKMDERLGKLEREGRIKILDDSLRS